MQSLDQLLKQRNLPDNQLEAFKTGFTDGFMRSQAFTQRTQGMCSVVSVTVAAGFLWVAVLSSNKESSHDRHKEILTNLHLCSVFTDSLRRTRLILLVLLLLGIYGLSRTPFLSGKGSFSDAGLFQFLFFPMLANQSTTLHAHCK